MTMKKILAFMLTAISVFAVASCQVEDLGGELSGDTQVTFKLGIPDEIVSRAEDSAIDHLVYAVYNEDKALVSEAVSLENVVFQGDTQSVQLTLVKGMTYTIAFWAQNSECDAYTVVAGEDGMTVEVDYNGLNNDMAREAFFACESFKVVDNLVVEVVLHRPFAKINLGVSAADWNAAKAAGLNVTESKVVISSAPTKLDILTDTVSGEAVVTYDFAAIPGSGAEPQDFVVNEKNCKLLSSSFILADKEKSVIAEGMQFALKADNGKVLTIEEGLENTPVQRNFATNVVASLTGDLDFSVSKDQDINGETVVPEGDVEYLKAALADASVTEIVLPYGVYEGVFLHSNGPKTIKSADPERQAVIRGKIGVAAEVVFENITFDVHDSFSTQATGNKNVDGVAGRKQAIVPVYAAEATFKGCNFYNICDSRNVAAIHYGAHTAGTMLTVENCYFEGYAYTIYTRALVSVTNSTFNQTHSTANPRAIFLYGLADGNKGNVIFKNNTAAGKTSYTMEMSSSTYEGDYTNIHYDVKGNTNFSVNGEAFLPRLEEGWNFSGTTFAEGSETFNFDMSAPMGDVEAFKVALADPSVTEIVLPYGIYEGVFFQTVSPKTIKSANPDKPATIKGKLAVTEDVVLENLVFDVHDEYSLASTGIDDIDKKERKAIVAVATAKATIEGCKFYNLYDKRTVVAVNYGAFEVGSPLEINNCYFEGYAYAIYTRALVSVTNSTFNQTHSTANPRAIFLYGLDGVAQGNVVFKNNTAAGKTSYTMQMMSTTYTPSYKKIHYDVQGNTNFSVNGEAFLPDTENCDFTGTTFAEGSETFEFGVPAGDVEAFKVALADPSVTEIVLPYGIYEGVFFQTVSPKTIKSANPDKPATIKGKLAVTEDVVLENLVFDVHDEYSLASTGIDDIDKKERKAIVAVATAKATIEGCKFYNLYDKRTVVAVNYGAFEVGSPLEINNCYFEGYAYAIYTRALVSVTNSTFNQTHSTANPRAIFLYGLDGVAQGNVVFKNNTAAGKTSYTMQMMSTTYTPSYKKIHYDVQGNTNFSVNGEAFLPDTDNCDFTGTTFAPGSETFEFKEEVVEERFDTSNMPAGDVAAFKAALADASVTEIVLPYGVYEGLFFHTKGAKTIKSADPAKPAVIKGKVAVSSANLAFENVTFDVHDTYSVESTGDAQIDKIEGRRKAIVTIYAAQVTFEGCKFYNLYDERSVVAIHYGAHVSGATLGVNNCYFQGNAYAIYTRALVSVTNSTFNQTHSDVNPRAIFLYGRGDGKQGDVVFKNNTAAGKTSYTMQMSSTNYDYKNIRYDVQGNTNFSVDGEAFLARTDGVCDFTGTTFAEGSETFAF